MSSSPALWFYRAATAALWPFAGAWLDARARQGKEDPDRLGERFGRYRQARPGGQLIWLHAASVGESGVALQLIEALGKRDPALSFLLTTGTQTSANLIASRAPARTTHAYAPLDRTRAVRRFFTHWRPDLGVLVESELWPHLILEAEKRNVPLALVNARMSQASLRRWRNWAAAAGRLLRVFAYVSAADARTAQALTSLRGAKAAALGNLKLAARAPPVDAAAQAALRTQLGGRPMWLAASTHAGEDEIALAAHARLRAEFPRALLVLAPRHPERGAAVAELAGGGPRRALAQPIGEAPVYVADTMGELGLFYDAAGVALVGGSLLAHLKGHNPIEPAKLGAAVLTGPHVESFEDTFAALLQAGGALRVDGAEALASAVAMLWRDEDLRVHQVRAARRVVESGAHALDETVTELATLLPARVSLVHAPA